MVANLLESRISCVSIMKDVSISGHPFVGRSYLTIGRHEESDADFDIITEPQVEPSIRPDRPIEFIIDDSPNMGPGCARAVKSFGRVKGAQKVTALAVRVYGSDKHSRIIRFYTWDLENHLFNYKNRNGRITIHTDTEEEETATKQDVEFHILEDANVPTVTQRCADWFTMREFRLTSTSAMKLLLNHPKYRESMGLLPLNGPPNSPSDTLETLAKSWFNMTRSTDDMLRGTVNEDAVLNSFYQQTFIDSVFKGGMLRDKQRHWLAASFDAVAVFDYNVYKPNYHPETQERDLRVAPVEIKTAVARETVGRGTSLATPELLICDTTSDTFKQYVPKEHAAQIIHQCCSCNMRWAFYVQATEFQILFVLLIGCNIPIRNIVEELYYTQVTPALSWAHTEPFGTQLLTGDSEIDKLISARLPFWRMLSNEITAKGPFVPMHIFKHASQTLYNKTKGGVDGNAQMRAILRWPKDTLKREQKVVTQIFKSITVDAWLAWRQLQREDMVTSREQSKGLDQYRHALNRVEHLADFIYELTTELLAYADTVDRKNDSRSRKMQATGSQRPLRKNEQQQLILKAKQRKRYRVLFFNSSDGILLRLNNQRHEYSGSKEKNYCALCGNNTKTSFRRHRTLNMCKQCHVHLCVKIGKPFKRSCWDVWHSVKKVRPRQPQIVNDAAGNESEAEGTDSTQELSQTTRASKRPRNDDLEQQQVRTRARLDVTRS